MGIKVTINNLVEGRVAPTYIEDDPYNVVIEVGGVRYSLTEREGGLGLRAHNANIAVEPRANNAIVVGDMK